MTGLKGFLRTKGSENFTKLFSETSDIIGVFEKINRLNQVYLLHCVYVLRKAVLLVHTNYVTYFAKTFESRASAMLVEKDRGSCVNQRVRFHGFLYA